LVAFRQAYAARSLFAGFAMAIFWIVGVVSLGALGWATLKARDAATIFFVV
jgi:hypothetical protein